MLYRSREPEIQCLPFASQYHFLFSSFWDILYFTMRFEHVEGRVVNFFVVWIRVDSSFKALITPSRAHIITVQSRCTDSAFL